VHRRGQFWDGSWRNRIAICGLDSSGSGYGSVVGYCENGDESPG
jgi:hypothetical protein